MAASRARGAEPEVRRESRGGHTGGFVRPEKRLAIYLRDKFRCLYCGIDLHDAWLFRNQPGPEYTGHRGSSQMLSLDHLDGRENHHQGNLVTSCLRCNTRRGALKVTWKQFLGTLIDAEFRDAGGYEEVDWKAMEYEKRYRNILNARRRKLNMPLAKSLINGRVRADVRTAEEG